MTPDLPKNPGLSSSGQEQYRPRRLRLAGRKRQRLSDRRQSRQVTPPQAVDVVQHYEREKAFRERLIANAAPLVSAATFAFVVLKVLLVADANVSTALSIVKEAGPITVVAGVLIVGIPFLGTGFVNAAGIMARSTDLNRYEKRRLWSYYVGGAFVLSFVVSWPTMLLLAGFPVVSWLIWRKNRKKRASSESTSWETIMASTPDDAELRRLLGLARPLEEEIKRFSQPTNAEPKYLAGLSSQLTGIRAAYNERVDKIRDAGGARLDALAVGLMLTTLAPLLQFSLNSTPWLAAEKVKLGSGEMVIAYVVSTKDDWATLLIDKPRLVRNVPISDIKDRETCVTTEESNARQTLWSLPAGDPPTYPKCR